MVSLCDLVVDKSIHRAIRWLFLAPFPALPQIPRASMLQLPATADAQSKDATSRRASAVAPCSSPAAVPRLVVAELPLHDTERMLDFRAKASKRSVEIGSSSVRGRCFVLRFRVTMYGPASGSGEFSVRFFLW